MYGGYCKVCYGWGTIERYYSEFDIYDQECQACDGSGYESEED